MQSKAGLRWFLKRCYNKSIKIPRYASSVDCLHGQQHPPFAADPIPSAIVSDFFRRAAALAASEACCLAWTVLVNALNAYALSSAASLPPRSEERHTSSTPFPLFALVST